MVSSPSFLGSCSTAACSHTSSHRSLFWPITSRPPLPACYVLGCSLRSLCYPPVEPKTKATLPAEPGAVVAPEQLRTCVYGWDSGTPCSVKLSAWTLIADHATASGGGVVVPGCTTCKKRLYTHDSIRGAHSARCNYSCNALSGSSFFDASSNHLTHPSESHSYPKRWPTKSNGV